MKCSDVSSGRQLNVVVGNPVSLYIVLSHRLGPGFVAGGGVGMGRVPFSVLQWRKVQAR